MSDLRAFFENVLYRAVSPRRFTQQSPVMPDVWIAHGMNPGHQVELLMVPDWHYTTADLARALKERLAEDRASGFEPSRFRHPKAKAAPAAVAYNQNVVVARLFFDELIRVVIPLSRWWTRSVAGMRGPEDPDRLVERLSTPEGKRTLARNLTAAMKGGDPRQVTPDTVWLARVVGLIAYLATPAGRKRLGRSRGDRRVGLHEDLFEEHSKLAQTVIALLEGMEAVDWEDDFPLYSVNRNRTTQATLHDSVGTIKADAARRVFQVTGNGIRWAVVDSGIDARHPAFRELDGNGMPKRQAFARHKRKSRRRAVRGSDFRNQTRIRATYDFVQIRELLGLEPEEIRNTRSRSFRELSKRYPALELAKNRKQLISLIDDPSSHLIDWQKLEPFLRVPHEPEPAYRPPVNRHGTHVAGIIAADWKGAPDNLSSIDDEPANDEDALEDLYRADGDLQGIGPQIELYDLRVLDENGEGNEFAIMSALQFVRDLNNRKDFVAIHGVNLSFSIEHDVANYACGRTPVCDEANRLVASGLTVVAAAGNSGRARYMTPSGLPDEGFRTVSITDPGNAEAVITVGATHRRDPHTYGVSYFSSRGPTGDGRLKPDLVAPGEKIRSTIPDGGDDRLDGTSMAAPHVSGTAALIMARHFELIGQPQRIKEILCSTATDLGRERYFQGSGMLDILRALESI